MIALHDDIPRTAHEERVRPLTGALETLRLACAIVGITVTLAAAGSIGGDQTVRYAQAHGCRMVGDFPTECAR